MTTRWKVISGFALVVVIFLAGFVPQFIQKRSLQTELEDTRRRLDLAQRQADIDNLRNLAGRMLLAASRQNYGIASEHSTEYFNRLRELQNKTGDASLRNMISSLLEERDAITSGLAQGNSSIVPALLLLLERTYGLPNVTR